MNPIQRVAIVGGTHGNEFTGIYLIEKFTQNPNLIHRSTFETLTLLANPKAFEAGRRYIDKDLNRCFLREELEYPTLFKYEEIRAKEIAKMLSSESKDTGNFIVDLHSTTTNMGLTIILHNYHPFNLKLVAYLSSINPLVKVYSSTRSGRDHDTLRSLCELGFAIEVGPVAQGVLNAELFQKTEALIYSILDCLEGYNSGKIPQFSSSLTLYQYLQTIDYPRNEKGKIKAMIHPQLQFKDYEPLNPGDPMFLTFDGKTIAYEGKSTVYPVFINEAAYYEKGVAMCFSEKQEIAV